MGGQLSSGQGGLLDGYLNTRDVFDGGGPGRSGDKFEGGGLLSFIANMFAKPLPPLKGQMPAALPAARGPQPMPYNGPPAMASRGTTEPQQTYTVQQGVDAPLSYGPPARALVGTALQRAMNPDRGPSMTAPAVSESPELFVPQTDFTPRPAAVGIPRVAAAPDTMPKTPRPQAVSLVDEFEAYLATRPNAAILMDQFNKNPAAATKLMQHWLMNGKQLPGM